MYDPDVARPAGCRAAACRPRRPGGDAARGDLHGPPLRPALRNRGRCILGRETAIQRMVWSDDGWLRTDDGAGFRRSKCRRRSCRNTFSRAPEREDFDSRICLWTFNGCGRRGPRSCSASPPGPAIYAFTAGRRSGSQFRQSLVARRQQAHCYSAETVMEFEPDHFQQWPAWSAITAAPSFTTSTFPTTRIGEARSGDVVPSRSSPVRRL